MRMTLAATALALSLPTLAVPAHAEEECFLRNPSSSTAVVRIVDESAEEERVVHLFPRQRIRVRAENGSIEYEYYYPPEESEFHDKTTASCRNGREIRL